MDTKFDEKLELMEKQATRASSNSELGKPSWTEIRNSAIFVTDTLDLCWVAAKSLFGDKATPDCAIAIYDRMLDRMEFKAENEIDETN